MFTLNSRSLCRFASFVIFSLTSLQWVSAQTFETITFESEDGLTITADLYQVHESKSTPFIVLFHQASYSRGEYRDIAPELNAMGFNAMAIDQRAGSGVNGVSNETAKAARAAKKPTAFLDAQQDMRAAIALVKERYASGSVIGWGSSYSSALILKLASESPDLVNGTLSFSPGEYFSPRNLITESVANLHVPAFVTSARGEAGSWSGIFDAAASAAKVSYLPTTSGRHGSSALWSSQSDRGGYWQAVSAFLAQWQVAEEPMTSLRIDPAIRLQVPASHRLYVSTDLIDWAPIATVNASEPVAMHTGRLSEAFFRSEAVTEAPVADVVSVTTSGSSHNYTFSVRLESPDLGCEQYADWWEVLSEDGALLYRRILTHSHVNEQPFTRSGGKVAIGPNEVVIVRAHMNAAGFGGQAFQGSVAAGFEAIDLPGTFASWVTLEAPLPSGCGF